MASSNTCKCRFCGTEIDKATAVQLTTKKGFYFCNKDHMRAYEDSKVNTNKKNFKSIKGTDREQCTDRIQYIYEHELGYDRDRIPWNLIGAQLKNLLDDKDNGINNYATISFILDYMLNIIDFKFSEDKGTPLSLVPYYFYEAKDYYVKLAETKKSAENYKEAETIVAHASNSYIPTRYKEISFDN